MSPEPVQNQLKICGFAVRSAKQRRSSRMHTIEETIAMMNRKLRTASQIVLILGLVVMLYAGVLSGLQRAWFAMAFFISGAVISAGSYVWFLLNLKIDKCFERLEGTISGKAGAFQVGNRLRFGLLVIFWSISAAAMLSLSILAGFRQRWLMVCILLAATIVVSNIFSGAVHALRIQARSKRLEELIRRD